MTSLTLQPSEEVYRFTRERHQPEKMTVQEQEILWKKIYRDFFGLENIVMPQDYRHTALVWEWGWIILVCEGITSFLTVKALRCILKVRPDCFFKANLEEVLQKESKMR